MSVGGETLAEPAASLWICESCGFIDVPEEGDPDCGIAPETPFEDIPDDWMCFICGATTADSASWSRGSSPRTEDADS